MKNVMVRAWEIAKGAAVRFGGKAKEYFAQALTMAWKDLKEGAKNFGFNVVKKLNGSLYYVVEDVDGLEVSVLNQRKSVRTGKAYTHRMVAEGRRVVEKSTGKVMKYFSVTMDNEAIEFKLGSRVSVLDINRGGLSWR